MRHFHKKWGPLEVMRSEAVYFGSTERRLTLWLHLPGRRRLTLEAGRTRDH